VFRGDSATDHAVFAIHPDGTGLRRVNTEHPMCDCDTGVLSSDGRYMAVDRWDADGFVRVSRWWTRRVSPGDSSINRGGLVGPSDRTGAQAQEAGLTPEGFAVQMATFQSAGRAAQAAQEFRDAGYLAYSVERSLRDGTRVHAVILGPYMERADAERARERAREIPGYDSGLIVAIDPDALSLKTQ